MNTWKTIKIFVSSTFKDMDVERDALRNILLPRLNEHFAPAKRNIQIVDLRHSVETDLNQSAEERERCVFNICMKEIQSCQPYFIGLVGHRYGWIPDMQKMGVNEQVADLLPNDFPLNAHELSVTAYEFLNGLFNKHFSNDRALVWMRHRDSYQDIRLDDLNNFVDHGKEADYIERFRNYLQQGNLPCQVETYTLNPINPSAAEMENWCNKLYQSLVNLIEHHIEEEQEQEISPFMSAQDLFIHQMTQQFEGRETDIDLCLETLERREALYICEKESGMGQTALLCQLYKKLAENPHHCCLFHSPQAITQCRQYRTVFYHWCLTLLHELQEVDQEAALLTPIADDSQQLFNRLVQLCMRVTNERGKTIYLLVDEADNMDEFPPLRQAMIRVAETIKCQDNSVDVLSPFWMNELTDADKKGMTKHLRHQTQIELLKKKQSGNPRWLRLASTILENLNKMDYGQIRNQKDFDNEARIDHYLEKIVAELPDEYEALCLYWMERLKHVFGTSFVDKYTGALGICQGLSDEALSYITGRNIDWCIYFRQMMGPQMVRENADRLWDFSSEEMNNVCTMYKGYYEPQLISQLYSYVSKLPANDPIVRQNLFILSLLTQQFDACTTYISQKKHQQELLEESPNQQAFFKLLLLDRKLFLHLIQTWVEAATPSYEFYQGLNAWSELIIRTGDFQYYIDTLQILIDYLEKLNRGRKLNDTTAMALAYTYDAIGRGYIEIPNGNDKWNHTNQRALDICKRYSDGSSAWNVLLTQLMYHRYEGYSNLNDRWQFLKNEFLPLENQGITFEESSRNLSYGFLLREVAILSGPNKAEENIIPCIRKAYQVFEKNYLRSIQEKESHVLCNEYFFHWMQGALFMLIIHENTNLPALQEVHQHIDHLLRTYDSHQNLWLMSTHTEAVYYRLLAYLAMSVAEVDPQTGIRITDLMCHKLSFRTMHQGKGMIAENESKETKNGLFYSMMCTTMEKWNDLKDKPITHLEISQAWCITARLYIESLVKDDEKLDSQFPLEPDSEWNALTGLGARNSNKRWDRELDTCYPMCYAIHAQLNHMKKGNFPDVKVAEELIQLYDHYFDLCRQMSYRHVNFKQQYLVKNILQQTSLPHDTPVEQIPQEVLEEWIEKEEYDTLIQTLTKRNEGSKEECYYLALALLRHGQVDDSINLFYGLSQRNELSPSFRFSCYVNFLYGLLVSGRTEQFAMQYNKLSDEDKEDSDIEELYACYKAWEENGKKNLSVPTPYGYII